MSNQKVNSIYDAIDNRNYKLAIQIADKVKNPADLVLALKSLALARSGRKDEAKQITNVLISRPKLDGNTLNTLLYTLKQDYSLPNLENIVLLYRNALQTRPKDFEVNVQYFNALLRLDEWKALSTQALKLKTLAPASPTYLWWTICLNIIQGTEYPGGINLVLAEKMCEKAMLDKKLFNDKEHVLVYLHLLDLMKKFDKQVEFLESESCREYFKLAGDHNEISRRVLTSGGNLNAEKARKLLKLARKRLVDQPDDWVAVKDLNTATIVLPDFIDSTRDLYMSLEESNSQARGPLLGRIDLQYRLITSQDTTDARELLFTLVGAYFVKFGHVYCFFEDLKQYLSCINNPANLLSILIQMDTKGENNPTHKIKRDINLKKMARYFSLLDTKDFDLFSQSTYQAYQATIPFGLDAQAKEVQPGDDYLILYSHECIDKYLEKKDTKFLFQALVVLEYALRKSAFNYQIKILLLRIYYQLGAFHFPLQHHVPSLEIKQILLDSMSWVYIEGLQLSGHDLKDSLRLYAKTLEIYSRNEIECADMLILAFEKNTYSKIFEFLNFRNQLRCSLQQAISRSLMVKTEIRIHACNDTLREYLAQYESTQGYIQKLDGRSTEYFDNRDSSVVLNWTNKSICSELAGRETPNQNQSLRDVFRIIPFFLKSALGQTSDWEEIKFDSCEKTGHEHMIKILEIVTQILLGTTLAYSTGKRNLVQWRELLQGYLDQLDECVTRITYEVIQSTTTLFETFLYSFIGVLILKSKKVLLK